MTGWLLTLALSFAPALLIFATLSRGCYPGARVLARRAVRSVQLPRPRPAPRSASRGWIALEPRGGLLLATALAGRAPPG
jgi:hypothetical protein